MLSGQGDFRSAATLSVSFAVSSSGVLLLLQLAGARGPSSLSFS